jgi:Zn-dependent protease with chaperone function
VLEGLGVRESLRRGFDFVIENWKNVGLMWLVMIGLGIVWAFASIILFIVTIPLVIVTAAIAALVAAVPFLLFAGIFSTFLSGWLPWAAGGLFVAPLFFTLAFAPWVLVGSWQAVYTSTVWTLTYREIKALPAIAAPEPKVEPPAELPPAS